jgi:hypothetical protein
MVSLRLVNHRHINTIQQMATEFKILFAQVATASGLPPFLAGMDVLHLQAMLGHASLDMVQHYAQMVDDDLLHSHQAHSPIDNLARLQ